MISSGELIRKRMLYLTQVRANLSKHHNFPYKNSSELDVLIFKNSKFERTWIKITQKVMFKTKFGRTYCLSSKIQVSFFQNFGMNLIVFRSNLLQGLSLVHFTHHTQNSRIFVHEFIVDLKKLKKKEEM